MAQVEIYNRKDIEMVFRVFLCKHKQYEWFINSLGPDKTIEWVALNIPFRDYTLVIKDYGIKANYEIIKKLDDIWYGKLYCNNILRLI
jgi:hypothetical protein